LRGVIALLRYFAERDSKSGESIFPDNLFDQDDPAVGRWGTPYSYFITRNAARALGKLAVQS
jgi:hypothetical protein